MNWKMFAIRMALILLGLQIIEELKTVTWPDTIVQLHRCAWDIVGWSAVFAFPIFLVGCLVQYTEYHPWMVFGPMLGGFVVACVRGLRRI